MKLDDFDFHLPEGAIALRPAEPRDSARLLHVPAEGAFADRIFRDLPGLLRPEDVLVFNDTKVLPAAFTAVRAPRADHPLQPGQPLFGPRLTLNLHKRLGPNTWAAFAKGARKAEPGDRLTLNGELGCLVVAKAEDGELILAFELEGEALDEAIQRTGHVPLPPYIAAKRGTDERDRDDYQTIYAKKPGAVAAPTAGLHFTPAVLEAIRAKGTGSAVLTLHVGAGTFLPVKAETVADHKMHAEWGQLTEATAGELNARRRAGGRIVAVGTTSLRLLESAAAPDGTILPFAGETAIFITPGYRFRAAGALITNFHLPKSTLMMLVSAFAGHDRMRAAYSHAIACGYRFYSYGDSSLLERAP
jgi:S-adenosylmethionine:tRNA ribosyltransferase-isomerase